MMKKITALLLATGMALSLHAQNFELVKDIEPGSIEGPDFSPVQYKGKLYFSARNHNGTSPYANVGELWMTDGTDTGTKKLLNLTSNYPYYPGGFTEYNGKFYFAATDTTNARELWVSDGTDTGTKIFKNINPELYFGAFKGSGPMHFIEYNGKLYFSADDGTHGRELWVSDGTDTGTRMLKDINPGAGSNNPEDFTIYNNKLYFAALDSNGHELWVSDGTEAGTKMVKDIKPGSGSSYPYGFTEYNGKLYFAASDGEIVVGEHGKELWVTDGTDTGTKMVKDITPGTIGSISKDFLLTELNGKLYFVVDNVFPGSELWVTDGTDTGTVMVSVISTLSSESYVKGFFKYNGKLYFSAADSIHGRELWVTDGTDTGTMMLKDINPGSGSGILRNRPFEPVEYNGKLYFFASKQLWVTDGTAQNTVMVSSNVGSNPTPIRSDAKMHVFDGALYIEADFDGSNREKLWKFTDAPLPVTWLSFDATAIAAHTASLNWKTAAEKDNSHFEVERSYDGKSFKAIGKVPSAGNTDGTTEYHFIDDQISRDVVYYRIKQVDIDGRFTYSTIAEVVFQTEVGVNNLTIVPNPGQGFISLQIADFSNQESIKVTDINGRLVFQTSVSGSAVNIPAAPGMYVVSLLDKTGAVIESQKAIVE